MVGLVGDNARFSREAAVQINERYHVFHSTKTGTIYQHIFLIIEEMFLK